MYLDADSGSLSFGSDHTFYGTAFDGIPTDQPLYPMVSAVLHGATITLFYRGEGDISRVVNMTMTPAGPPLEKPFPREEPPPYTAGPATYSVPLERGATTMSKMTEACGPPPPPPTKMSNNPHGHDLHGGSQSSLKKDEHKAIPEEHKKEEEEEKKHESKNEEGEAAVTAEAEEVKTDGTTEEGATTTSEQAG
ncbi:F-box/SPRY domain-containing protein 1 [Elysia marginata]|uniref:F-box/SPRY domain-containing protein 1 n=1 Tax=Elysia marginata TaxID=1093978 RepID=A0AAV4ITG9_9GAST|nr:F-box/SPRY domain-containing protein 1 [Elysia marginata]